MTAQENVQRSLDINAETTRSILFATGGTIHHLAISTNAGCRLPNVESDDWDRRRLQASGSGATTSRSR